MKFVLFYHSLVSDWNHGNAHFLRGIATELIKRGHDLAIYEPRDGWSLSNLVAQNGSGSIREFQNRFPLLHSICYDLNGLESLPWNAPQGDIHLDSRWTSWPRPVPGPEDGVILH